MPLVSLNGVSVKLDNQVKYLSVLLHALWKDDNQMTLRTIWNNYYQAANTLGNMPAQCSAIEMTWVPKRLLTTGFYGCANNSILSDGLLWASNSFKGNYARFCCVLNLNKETVILKKKKILKKKAKLNLNWMN